jgi:hypothetical protein
MPVPNTKENRDKCICRDCPSYNQCMSDGREGLFCAVGKSKCEIKKEFGFNGKDNTSSK